MCPAFREVRLLTPSLNEDESKVGLWALLNAAFYSYDFNLDVGHNRCIVV